MKNLLIVIILFISTLSLHAQTNTVDGHFSKVDYQSIVYTSIPVNNIVNNHINPAYTKYINFVCNELDINDITLYVYQLKAGTGVFNNSDILGYVEKRVIADDVMYIIYINSNQTGMRNVCTVLGHEITHIRQDLDGYDILTNGSVSIKGNELRYTSNTAEILEKEAVRYSFLLYKSYKKRTKSYK